MIIVNSVKKQQRTMVGKNISIIHLEHHFQMFGKIFQLEEKNFQNL